MPRNVFTDDFEGKPPRASGSFLGVALYSGSTAPENSCFFLTDFESRISRFVRSCPPRPWLCINLTAVGASKASGLDVPSPYFKTEVRFCK